MKDVKDVGCCEHVGRGARSDLYTLAVNTAQLKSILRMIMVSHTNEANQ
jgi:hypothetical protein